jgi:hypothetical protein
MYLKKLNVTQEEIRNSFFGNNTTEPELDEDTFDMWKEELQKELSTFWRSMNR